MDLGWGEELRSAKLLSRLVILLAWCFLLLCFTCYFYERDKSYPQRFGGLSWCSVFRLLSCLAYVLFLVGFFAVCGGQPIYDEWLGLFRSTPMRIFTLIAMMALTGHIWVGVWTV